MDNERKQQGTSEKSEHQINSDNTNCMEQNMIDNNENNTLDSLISSFNNNLESYRQQRQAEIDREINTLREKFNEERQSWDDDYKAQQKALREESEAQAKKQGELNALQDKLIGWEKELDLREKYIDKEIQERTHLQKKSFETEKAELKDEKERLWIQLQEQNDEIIELRSSKAPEVLNQEKESLKKTIKEQKEYITEIINERMSKEDSDRFKELEKENEANKKLIGKLEGTLLELKELNKIKYENEELEAKNSSLKNRVEYYEKECKKLNEELKRHVASYERSQERDERIKEILGKPEPAKYPKAEHKEINEIDWLNNISKQCEEFGIIFPQRILKAFHTSLKTAEMSPLTVLAGVSGTGKSELPKLYAHFGGLAFEAVSVQPNWDSQESMLGFFNSIDNKFDAQPILHFLAQSQQEYSQDYPGLKDRMCLVLLDEMNLAHPELYFAEFLSKFELRRSYNNDNLPSIQVKIGAGLEPYKLPLGRNVLWTGTMNQDETTKSLSDKVLDRSIIINFPRPEKLVSRKGSQEALKAPGEPKPMHLQTFMKCETTGEITEKDKPKPMHLQTFMKWVVREALPVELINPYKEFLENINKLLGVAGRAIGHRVWQSIENYVANYPDVRENINNDQKQQELKEFIHIAFEDQLVQKVMPKLRGIDTRGKTKTDCLKKIRTLLSSEGVGERTFENLLDDFDIACDLGYGQFMWQSANYINKN